MTKTQRYRVKHADGGIDTIARRSSVADAVLGGLGRMPSDEEFELAAALQIALDMGEDYTPAAEQLGVRIEVMS